MLDVRSLFARLLPSFVLGMAACAAPSSGVAGTSAAYAYAPPDHTLHNEIAEADRRFFTAYNECDLDTQAAMTSEDLEFFHEKGGCSTSKQQLLDAARNNICGAPHSPVV